MIRKSLFAGIALLLLYGIFFEHLPRRYYGIYNQLRNNYRRAQHYLHDVKELKTVIVGSSASNELSDSILGPDCLKLTFPGAGVFTGMEALCRSKRRPEFVLVEANALLHNSDNELLNDLFSPWRRSLRSLSNIFREEGRPSNFAIGVMYAAVNRTSLLLSSGNATAVVPDGNAKIFDDVMRSTRQDFSRPPDARLLAKCINRLEGCIRKLETRGSACIFFEMPIDSSLANLAEPKTVRMAILARFPKTRYPWIHIDSRRAYQTVDGVHLTRNAANDVSKKISAYLDTLIQSQAQERMRPEQAPRLSEN